MQMLPPAIKSIRPARLEDAGAFWELTRIIESERPVQIIADFEQLPTIEEQKMQIDWFLRQPDKRLLLVVETETGKLAGYGMLMAGDYTVDSRTASLVIEISSEWCRKGIGTLLCKHLEEAAKERNLHRLELSTLANNTAALGLYEKCGFAREGLKREARWINHKYEDECMLAKLLGS